MKKTSIIFILIIVVASALRLVNISTNPPAIYWEEAALGYDAYSILKTARDYHGNFLPILAFPSFGDYKPSLYFYAIVPFLAMFGQSTLAIRLPSALAGIATVYLVYLIGKKMKDERFGLLASGLFAIQPWSVHMSRIGFEANFALMLVTASVYFLLETKRKSIYIIFASITSVLAMYTYHADRIVAPLLALWIALTYGLIKIHKWLILACVIAVLAVLPIVLNLTNPVIAQRAAETSILSGTALVEKSNILREADGNTLISRILHYRYMVMGQAITAQYLNNFSPKFLFLNGDGNVRHSNSMTGALYAWELFAIFVGLYGVLRFKKYQQTGLLILPWILISAIPAALTTVSPHALRFLSAAPAFALLSSIGVATCVDALHVKLRKLFIACMVCIIALFFVAFLHAEFVLYPKTSAREWQYGYKELTDSIQLIKKPSQKVFITREQGRPSIYVLWYTKQDPKEIQRLDASLQKDQQELLEFGQYIFGDRLPSESGMLIAGSPKITPTTAKILKSISLPTGEVIWNVWEQ